MTEANSKKADESRYQCIELHIVKARPRAPEAAAAESKQRPLGRTPALAAGDKSWRQRGASEQDLLSKKISGKSVGTIEKERSPVGSKSRYAV